MVQQDKRLYPMLNNAPSRLLLHLVNKVQTQPVYMRSLTSYRTKLDSCGIHPGLPGVANSGVHGNLR